MGVGILPDWFISREINAKELVALPLGAKRLIRPWGVSISEAKPLDGRRELLLNVSKNLARDGW